MKRRVFKIVFEVDFEYFQEKEGSRVNSESIIKVKKKTDTRNINPDTPFAETILHKLEYLEKHLEKQIEDTITTLYSIEGFIIGRYMKSDPNARDLVIKKMKGFETKARRKRLSVKRGRPYPYIKNFNQKREEFIKDCIGKLNEIKKENRPLNKKSLAEKIFPPEEDINGRDNIHRDLRDKLKMFQISFDVLLRQVTVNSDQD